jgi:uncharacterized membrane protein (DUF2068 family)
MSDGGRAARHDEAAAGARAADPRAAGVRAIAVYKCVKAVGELVLAGVLVALMMTGYIARAHDFVVAVRDNLVHHWSIRLAEAAMKSLTRHHIYWLVAALVGDSVVSGIEGVGLARGYGWAPWLVVAATAMLLPVEVTELGRHATLGRLFLFVSNLVIVLYLLRRQMREHHAAHPHWRRPPPPPRLHVG